MERGPPPTAGLPGYMMDFDLGNQGTEDITFRRHDATTASPTGRLMATTSGFTQSGNTGPDGEYAFKPIRTMSGR